MSAPSGLNGLRLTPSNIATSAWTALPKRQQNMTNSSKPSSTKAAPATGAARGASGTAATAATAGRAQRPPLLSEFSGADRARSKSREPAPRASHPHHASLQQPAPHLSMSAAEVMAHALHSRGAPQAEEASPPRRGRSRAPVAQPPSLTHAQQYQALQQHAAEMDARTNRISPPRRQSPLQMQPAQSQPRRAAQPPPPSAHMTAQHTAMATRQRAEQRNQQQQRPRTQPARDPIEDDAPFPYPQPSHEIEPSQSFAHAHSSSASSRPQRLLSAAALEEHEQAIRASEAAAAAPSPLILPILRSPSRAASVAGRSESPHPMQIELNALDQQIRQNTQELLLMQQQQHLQNLQQQQVNIQSQMKQQQQVLMDQQRRAFEPPVILQQYQPPMPQSFSPTATLHRDLAAAAAAAVPLTSASATATAALPFSSPLSSVPAPHVSRNNPFTSLVDAIENVMAKSTAPSPSPMQMMQHQQQQLHPQHAMFNAQQLQQSNAAQMIHHYAGPSAVAAAATGKSHIQQLSESRSFDLSHSTGNSPSTSQHLQHPPLHLSSSAHFVPQRFSPLPPEAVPAAAAAASAAGYFPSLSASAASDRGYAPNVPVSLLQPHSYGRSGTPLSPVYSPHPGDESVSAVENEAIPFDEHPELLSVGSVESLKLSNALLREKGALLLQKHSALRLKFKAVRAILTAYYQKKDREVAVVMMDRHVHSKVSLALRTVLERWKAHRDQARVKEQARNLKLQSALRFARASHAAARAMQLRVGFNRWKEVALRLAVRAVQKQWMADWSADLAFEARRTALASVLLRASHRDSQATLASLARRFHTWRMGSVYERVKSIFAAHSASWQGDRQQLLKLVVEGAEGKTEAARAFEALLGEHTKLKESYDAVAHIALQNNELITHISSMHSAHNSSNLRQVEQTRRTKAHAASVLASTVWALRQRRLSRALHHWSRFVSNPARFISRVLPQSGAKIVAPPSSAHKTPYTFATSSASPARSSMMPLSPSSKSSLPRSPSSVSRPPLSPHSHSSRKLAAAQMASPFGVGSASSQQPHHQPSLSQPPPQLNAQQLSHPSHPHSASSIHEYQIAQLQLEQEKQSLAARLAAARSINQVTQPQLQSQRAPGMNGHAYQSFQPAAPAAAPYQLHQPAPSYAPPPPAMPAPVPVPAIVSLEHYNPHALNGMHAPAPQPQPDALIQPPLSFDEGESEGRRAAQPKSAFFSPQSSPARPTAAQQSLQQPQPQLAPQAASAAPAPHASSAASVPGSQSLLASSTPVDAAPAVAHSNGISFLPIASSAVSSSSSSASRALSPSRVSLVQSVYSEFERAFTLRQKAAHSAALVNSQAGGGDEGRSSVVPDLVLVPGLSLDDLSKALRKLGLRSGDLRTAKLPDASVHALVVTRGWGAQTTIDDKQFAQLAADTLFKL